MSIISFTVPGKPVPKGRARAVLRHGKIGHYTPSKTVAYEKRVKAIAQQAMHGTLILEEAVELKVIAYFPYPKSWSKAKCATHPHHTGRPDLDNIIKSIKDALNKVVWKDDAQVVELSAEKYYWAHPAQIKVGVRTADESRDYKQWKSGPA